MERDEPELPEGDEPAFREPPDPHERTWLHPSEFGKLLGSRAADPQRRAARAERSEVVRPLAVPLIAGMCGAALMLGAIALTGNLRKPVTRPVVQQVFAGSTASNEDPDGASALVASLSPSLVGVRVASPDGNRTGSAFVYRSDGRMITSHRLVGDATAIDVLLADGSVQRARFLGGDPDTDVAVVALVKGSPPVAVMGKDGGLRPGQLTVAVGAPINPGSWPTVSMGVIAGLGQNTRIGARDYYDLITTTAISWPVQAGGALVNRNGAVIGVTMVPAGGEPAIAVPIDIARRVADEILDRGHASHAWLGITGTELDPTTAGEYGAPGGVLVGEVAPNSPAARAGVEVEDVITSVGGEKVVSQPSLFALLLHHQPGDAVTLTVVRAGKARAVHATLTDRPAQ